MLRTSLKIPELEEISFRLLLTGKITDISMVGAQIDDIRRRIIISQWLGLVLRG